jgi:hypothetical protein
VQLLLASALGAADSVCRLCTLLGASTSCFLSISSWQGGSHYGLLPNGLLLGGCAGLSSSWIEQQQNHQ